MHWLLPSVSVVGGVDPARLTVADNKTELDNVFQRMDYCDFDRSPYWGRYIVDVHDSTVGDGFSRIPHLPYLGWHDDK